MYDTEMMYGGKDLCSEITDDFLRECEIIDHVSEVFPECAAIKNFQTEGINITGYTEFRWKYHRDRVLYIRWEGLFLSIRQKLAVHEKEKGIAFPVTWNDGKNPIPFNGQGEARLAEEASHNFWCEATGIKDRGL